MRVQIFRKGKKFLLRSIEQTAMLKDLLYKVKIMAVKGSTDIAINALQLDSRAVKTGNCFIAVNGTQTNGHDYINAAVKNGAVAIICEMTAYEKNKGRKLFDKLIDLYVQYGLYKEDLISITKKGMNGAREIADMMQAYRDNPPKKINNSDVVQLLDYQSQTNTNLQSGESKKIELPKSNVLQFILADGSKISARPSGTEPKIKFYFSVNTKLDNAADYDAKEKDLDNKIEAIISDMRLKS